MATAIIFGAPGSGKTTNSTLVPGKTLLLCSDNSSLVLKNFDRPNLTIKEIPSFKEYIECFDAATASKQYDTVITDCLTDIIDGFIVECRESGKFPDVRQAYLLAYTKIKALVRRAAHCGTNCLFNCWEDHAGRDYIIDEVILKAIDQPRPTVSKYAPKMTTMKIDPDKIREVIGKGGAVIQKITAETNTKIDIEDDGSVCIAAVNAADGEKARQMIEAIAKDPEVGDLYFGKVTRIMNFGAFVEIAPGKEGLIRINHLDTRFVEKVEDVLNIGDETWCKVIEIDEKGRINLSRKQALKEMAEKAE